ALGDVRQVVAAGLAGTALAGTGAAGQRLGHVEGAGAAAVPRSHRAAGRTGEPGAVGAARAGCGTVRAAGPGTARDVQGADDATGASGTRARATGRTGSGAALRGAARAGRRTAGAAGRTGTARRAGPVGGTGARTAFRGRGLAGREPVAGRLLLGLRGARLPALGPGRQRSGGTGRRGGRRSLGRSGGRGGTGRRRRVVRAGRVLRVLDGLAHDDRRNGPGSGDVDPDPGRQRGLGLAFLRPRGRTAGVRTLVRDRRDPVGRGARRVGGRAAPVGPGGRSVSFTTQGRFSRLAPPPVSTSRRRSPRLGRSRVRGRLGG